MNTKQHSVNSNEASQGVATGNLEVVYIAEKEFERNDGHFSPVLVRLHNQRHGDKHTVVMCLSNLVSPSTCHPRIGHRRVFPLKWEWYPGCSSGRGPDFFPLTPLFRLTSVLTVWLTGQLVSSEPAGFFSQPSVQNFLITIALKTNISMALFSQQHPKLL